MNFRVILINYCIIFGNPGKLRRNLDELQCNLDELQGNLGKLQGNLDGLSVNARKIYRDPTKPGRIQSD